MDFTVKETNKVIIRFNDANVLELIVNKADLSISGILTDEINDKTYTIAGSMTEEE